MFAASCLRRIIAECCQGDRAHFDLSLAKVSYRLPVFTVLCPSRTLPPFRPARVKPQVFARGERYVKIHERAEIGERIENSVADPHLLLCGSGSRIQKMSIWIRILGGKD